MTPFQSTLRRHLQAISERDLDTYSATIADDLLVVTPNGTRIEGRAQVEDFHRQWFADTDWTHDVTVLRTVESADTASALGSVEYRDVGSDGEPYVRRYLLGMVFTRQGEEWRLLHDQCTPLPESG